MTIYHLILSASGMSGISFCGMLRKLEEANFLDFKKLKSVSGCSFGSLILVFLLLSKDKSWNSKYDLILDHQWRKVFRFSFYEFFTFGIRSGYYDRSIMERIYKPEFDKQNISCNITLLQFYELTKIEAHFSVVEINTFTAIDMSYLTHPNWKLLDVVYSSLAIPIIFEPLFYENQCYMDGGILSSYPLTQIHKDNPKEILCLGRHFSIAPLHKKSTFIEIFIFLFYTFLEKIFLKSGFKDSDLFYHITISTTLFDLINFWWICFFSKSREKILLKGEKAALEFLNMQTSKED